MVPTATPTGPQAVPHQSPTAPAPGTAAAAADGSSSRRISTPAHSISSGSWVAQTTASDPPAAASASSAATDSALAWSSRDVGPPTSSTSPQSGRSRPASIASIVLLPDPERPITAVIAPRRNSASYPANRDREPNAFVTCRRAATGSDPAVTAGGGAGCSCGTY